MNRFSFFMLTLVPEAKQTLILRSARKRKDAQRRARLLAAIEILRAHRAALKPY